MLKSLQNRAGATRIILGFIIGLIALMMIITLVPGTYQSAGDPQNTIAVVAGKEINRQDVERQINLRTQGQSLPPQLKAIYAKGIIDQLVFERVLQAEADRLGVRVSDEELSERIKLVLHSVFSGGAFLGKERYEQEVSLRGFTVAEFEEAIRFSLLEEKFRRLVTDGTRVSPEEIREEFHRRNQKVKVEYVALKPSELEAKITPAEAELAAFYEKNKARYQLPERRSAKYLLLDNASLASKVSVSEDELRAYYNRHIDTYKVQNRAKVSHILLKTVGKTDAEAEEIRKKAEDVLKKLRAGAKFADMAKQFSEDTSNKDKVGDLGWVVPGQMVPEFEKASFTQPVGQIGDLVKTMYGFHIVKVEARESARTKPFEEVRGEILPILTAEAVERLAGETVSKLTDAVRRNPSQPIEDLARQFQMTVATFRPMAAGGMILELGGQAPEVEVELFRLSPGRLSMPLRIDRGTVVISLQEVLPARQATLEEVRDRVLSDYRSEKSIEKARTDAESLAKRVKEGETLAAAAKAMGLTVKSSEPFSRTGSVPDLGSARDLAPAFTMPVGRASDAVMLGGTWAVYRVTAREEAKPEEFIKQMKELEQALLVGKQGASYDAFRTALKEKMAREGKLVINQAVLERITQSS